jgi:pimeloyl-ACP methyl ester carboxylesterase
MRRMLLSGVLALSGAVGVGLNPAAAQLQHAPPAMLFVANGSGDSNQLTENLKFIIGDARLPFRIDTTRWTCYGGPRQDHTHVANHRYFGAVMAGRVEAFRKHCPAVRVCLLGHSSGAHVVLAAAECLPPGSVERIVLFAPSVSTNYDLRRAIKATRSGIDVYYSCEDQVLDIAVDAYGTADGTRDMYAAGQVGFRRPPHNVPDANLYGLVRQYRYEAGVYAGTGHNGGHHGSLRPTFLRLVALPNMISIPH